jgi:hypothetical protein
MNKTRRKEKYEQRKQNGLCVRCGKPSETKQIFCNTCRDRKHATDKNLRNKRKEKGLCPDCKKYTENGVRCDRCKKTSNMRQKALTKKRKQEGCCDDCGKPADGKIYCDGCKNKRKERTNKLRITDPIKFKELRRKHMATWRNKCLVSGLCWRCGNNSIKTGKKMCAECLKKRHGEHKKRHTARISQGMCRFCGINPITGTTSNSCDECFIKKMSQRYFPDNVQIGKKILLDVFKRQNAKCPYTGITLVLGTNATLDHKVPTSRGGENHMSNLQWVYYGKDFNVNMMKRDILEENFLKAINTIYANIRTMDTGTRN